MASPTYTPSDVHGDDVMPPQTPLVLPTATSFSAVNGQRAKQPLSPKLHPSVSAPTVPTFKPLKLRKIATFNQSEMVEGEHRLPVPPSPFTPHRSQQSGDIFGSLPMEGSMTMTLTVSNIFRKQRSALPSFASNCRFEWHNLNVFVGDKRNKKQILFDFNGSVESGELLAVMGGILYTNIYKQQHFRCRYICICLWTGSGAGKSTLLNALSGRTDLNEQHVEGTLFVNDKYFSVRNQKIIKALCTFLPQSGILCPTQTVEEALAFYARLKLPNKTREEQAKRVKYLIDVLHLDRCRNNLIGDEKKVLFAILNLHQRLARLVFVCPLSEESVAERKGGLASPPRS